MLFDSLSWWALALFKIKNCVLKWTTPHSPARSLERHSLETSLHYEAKSSVIWNVQSYGASSQEGLSWTDFSWPQRKILRLINIVFDDILNVPESLSLQEIFDSYSLPDTAHVLLSHDQWRNQIEGTSKFTGSNAVFPARVQIYVFLPPKFSFKHWWMFNGNFKSLLDECFWLNNTQ